MTKLLARAAKRVVLGYVIAATAWILFSDLAVGRIAAATGDHRLVSILKGLLFVAVTGILLHTLLGRYERYRAALDAQLRYATRALRRVGACNRALSRATTEAELLQSVCDLLVQENGYRLAWVGFAHDDPGRSIHPVAHAGEDQGRLAGLRLTWAEGPGGQGPTGQAIRREQPVVCRQILTDPTFQSWRETAVARGYAASVALPFAVEGRTRGVITVHATEPDSFGEQETRLLQDLADNIAVGLGALRSRAQRTAAERSLRESEARLRLFVEHAPVAIALLDRDLRCVFASRHWRTTHRLGGDNLHGLPHHEIVPAAGKAWSSLQQRALAGEVVSVPEQCLTHADGRAQWLRWELRPWRETEGGPVDGVALFSDDISDRKLTEATLARQVVELRQWQEVTIGREDRILELKAEVNDLLRDADRPIRYPSAPAARSHP